MKVNCSGAAFNVNWQGTVIVNETIAVEEGSSLTIVGLDSNVVIDGNGTTQLFKMSGASLTLANVQCFNASVIGVGAAIFANVSTLFLENTTFEGNSASSDGGAMYMLNSTVSFTGHTTMTDNHASYGGTITVRGQDAVVSWSGVSHFSSNTCGAWGCAVYVTDGGRVSWSGETTFERNESPFESGAAVGGSQNASASWSGRTSFTSNFAGATGGAVYAWYFSSFSWEGETTFSNNTSVNGGAVWVSDSDCSWRGSTNFSDNSANSGGAIYLFSGSNVSWSGETSFTNNTAAAGPGGALHLRQSSRIQWSGQMTTFYNNTAVGVGGAVSAEADDTTSSIMIDGDTSFEDNESSTNGGAVALSENVKVTFGSDVEPEVNFTGNTAAGSGGALYVSTVAEGPVWSGVTFSGNYASIGGAVYSLASGTYVDDITYEEFYCVYDGCLFRDNVATATGGAVESVAGKDRFVNTSFVNNSARSGGAARLSGTADLLCCEFTDNGAYDEAPAVRNIGTIGTISNVSFAGNVLLCESKTFLDYVVSGHDGGPITVV